MPSDSEMTFLGKNRLLEYIVKCGVQKCVIYSDGALIDPVQFPLAAVETEGAVLFADLPGFSGLTAQMGAMEAAYYASHFFAWFEGEAGRCYGGIVDKFIGDEVMMVFTRSECRMPPFRAALCTARAMLGFDPYAFEPKIGIAAGPLAVALIRDPGHTHGVSHRSYSQSRSQVCPVGWWPQVHQSRDGRSHDHL